MNKLSGKAVAGVDEVGRGAWAGPLVAAAVVFKDSVGNLELKDSKLLSPFRRKQLAREIKKVSYWAIGIVSPFEIDKYGLQKANIDAARRAIDNLPVKPGQLKLDMIKGFTHKIKYQLIIRGDSKVLEIMAASIIAKEFRDQMMIDFHRHYKQYDFDIHKGYGTERHQAKLTKYGPSVLHRTVFEPVKKAGK